VGTSLGAKVGSGDGLVDGWKVGENVGSADGRSVGCAVGCADGRSVGTVVGLKEMHTLPSQSPFLQSAAVRQVPPSGHP